MIKKNKKLEEKDGCKNQLAGAKQAFSMYSGMKSIKYGLEYLIEALGGNAFEFENDTLFIYKDEYRRS